MTSDERMQIIIRDGYACQECGKMPGLNGLQIAHRIKQGKGSVQWISGELVRQNIYGASGKFIKKYIINHPDNLVTTCSLKCNAKQNIFFNPVKRDKLLKQIIKKVLGRRVA